MTKVKAHRPRLHRRGRVIYAPYGAFDYYGYPGYPEYLDEENEDDAWEGLGEFF